MNGTEDTGDFRIRVDFARILETISSRIYDNQFAFLRENLQNAIDAIRMQARREGKTPRDPPFRIDIRLEGQTCSIRDNGIGMSREELKSNFWTMGASGKNTEEARAAGCIGTFGIGGFANFGVCETLTVISKSEGGAPANKTRLSRSAFSQERFTLPTVSCEETDELSARGTIVIGESPTPFDVPGLRKYIGQYVGHVEEAIYFDKELISQKPLPHEDGERKPLLPKQKAGSVKFQLLSNRDSSLVAVIEGLEGPEGENSCSGLVKLEHGPLDTFKRGFKLCTTSISSHVGITGWIDCDTLRPTAGRDTLDAASSGFLTETFRGIEAAAMEFIVRDGDLLSAHVRLLPEMIRRGYLERLGLLTVDVVDGTQSKLEDVRAASGSGRRVFFSRGGQRTPTTDVLTARGNLILRLSGNRPRAQAEESYLRTYCQAQELETLVECLEVYKDLDSFDRAVLSEIDLAIRKLFAPPEFRLVPGRLSYDSPVYWTGKKDGGAIVAYVDTHHGELRKLEKLGYSPLFWSMIEVFCREYLGDTLKRQSRKFFGNGSVDLDAFSRTQSELWELMIGDIAVSRIGMKDTAHRQFVGRVELVSHSDIVQVTVRGGGVSTQPSTPPDQPVRTAPKLLHIVDETGNLGIDGFYLRIPESATAAFGEIIRTFPSFGAVWFANRLTWQGTDCESTAFLFDVTLDQLFGESAAGLAHGAVTLSPRQVQTYDGQIYFLIPSDIQWKLVPRAAQDVVRIELRPELVDLKRPRAWTAKE